MKKILLLSFIALVVLVVCSFSINISVPVGAISVEIFAQPDNLYTYSCVPKTSCMGMDIYHTDEQSYMQILDSINNPIGILFTYKNTDIEEIIKQLKCKIVKYEQVEDIIIYYAYTKYIDKVVSVDGYKINIQIACTRNCMKVGIPLIYGSY